MAKTEKYFVGPTLLGEIRDTITRVAGMPDRTSGAALPVARQDLQRPSGSGLRLGKTVDNWPKNSLGDVVVYGSGTALQEAAAAPPVVLED